jgi:hypothetical protein
LNPNFFTDGYGVVNGHFVSFNGRHVDEATFKNERRAYMSSVYKDMMDKVEAFYSRDTFSATEDDIQDSFVYTLNQIDKLNCNNVEQTFYNGLRGRILEHKRNKKKDIESIKKGVKSRRVVLTSCYVKNSTGDYTDITLDKEPMWSSGDGDCRTHVNDHYKLECVKMCLEVEFTLPMINLFFNYKLDGKLDKSIKSDRLKHFCKEAGIPYKRALTEFKKIKEVMEQDDFRDAVMVLYDACKFPSMDEVTLSHLVQR